ncbi:FAD-dependent oxidoreductase [Lacisediminihabitans sp.]|uniref:FAD-dependent oxidoreductase n=1 Tax=Lacisediminihabitans sp. TaxID=2787631 RepID=UPI00374D4564
MPRALIIGSGVAGPAVAQFLHASGWDVEIFDAQPAAQNYGGLFLNVATNGLAVLESLGLRQRLLEDGHRAPNMVMWSRTGKRLGAVPNGPAGDPARGSVIVKRDRLHEVLRDGATAAGIPLIFGARLVGIEETATSVRATFADGRVAEGDILIGCDGVGSPTRLWIDPAAPAPKYSGLVGLGGFARVEGLAPTPETQHFVFGARSFFGYLVRTDGTVYWFANITAPEPARGSMRGVSSDEWLARLRELHSDDPFPVPQILERAEGEIRAYPIYDLTHVPRWSWGRVVALGDAVHATSPSAGQGASLALEDAVTLANCLRDAPYDRAFAEYQRLRQPRAEAVVKYARAINAQKRVTKSRLGVAIRDAMMPMFLRRAANDTRNNWLYNHTIQWEDPAARRPTG